MEKREHATEVPSETFRRQASTQILGALIMIHFCHITAAFFKNFFCPFPTWLFICRFVSLLLLNLPFTGELLNYYGFIVQLAQMHDDSFEYFKLM